MKTTQLRKHSGSSLIVVLSVLATLMVVVAVAAEYTSTVNRHVQRSNTEQSALAVADSCIEILFANWRTICSMPGKVTTPQTTNDFNGVNGLPAIPLPTAQQLSLPNNTTFKRGTSKDPNNDEYDANYTISNYKVVGVNAQWNQLGSASTIPEPMFGQIDYQVTSLDPLVNKKIKTTPLVWNYIASANVTLPALGPTGNRTVVAKVRRVFQKQQLSPWNFAIFYVDPLEIHPGPPFTVTGWVHTNADLYTGHNTLTFATKVTYASDWFVDFMPGETTHDGETPAPPNYATGLPPARDQALQPFGLDSTSIFNTTDTNPNNDSYRELIEPPTASPDPMSDSRYWDQASVVIQVSDSPSANTVKIAKPHFNTTTGRYDGTLDVLSSSSTGNDLALYNMFSAAGTITTGQTIQDNREAASVRLVTLDLSKIQNFTNPLAPTFKATAAQGWNGIVYIYDSSATSSARRGVRLKNGSKIDKSGLTIASPNPVYIQGDYNSGRGSTEPLSNSTTSNDPATPQVPGYNRPSSESTLPGVRAPCAILADAVNILSNNWNDLNAELGDPLSGRQATNTTVNAAIIAGIVPSSSVGGDGTYSGGAENFPRFLEVWGSDNSLTYYGSMIQLWNSKQATGKWGSANVYDPPKRQWFFETNFRTSPPPGSLMLYSYVKGKWTLY